MRDHETSAALTRLANEVSRLGSEMREMRGLIRRTNRLEIQNMQGLDHLKAASLAQATALLALSAAVLASNQKIADLANTIVNSDDDAEVEKAAQEILAHTQSISDQATSLQNAVSGPAGGTGAAGGTGGTGGTGATGTGDGSGDAGGGSGNGAGT